jgi:adenylosuccinate lyase
MEMIPNVIAERYASEDMKALWSTKGRVRLERDLWIAVLKGQKDLGLAIPDGVIEAYESVIDQIDLASINQREAKTKHDVKARIEEFCDLAGQQHIHKGMTSRDLTENVEQLQVYRSLDLIFSKAVHALTLIAEKSLKYRNLVITARTHNVAAQPTTLGKRLVMFGEELLHCTEALESLISRYPVRGLKGAVGTQIDLLTLFDGNLQKVSDLERRILKYLNIWTSFKGVGQVYPRSLDMEVIASLCQLASAPSSFAQTLRLMAGHELLSEGFAKGQVGSSAMPHKMNARSCERICGFKIILGGYLNMATALAGSQWNEGDVSCSVVRRIMLPDAFFAIDGLFETFITVLTQMDVFEEVIHQENQRYFPFLITTTILMEAVKKGAGREDAHEAIKEHAVAVLNDLRKAAISQNDLLERLAADKRLGLSLEAMQAILADTDTLVGNAPHQVDQFISCVGILKSRHTDLRAYTPTEII